MKSLLIFLVENGEDTDELSDAVRAVEDVTEILDWTVRVDIPDDRRQFVFTHHNRDNLILGSGDWPDEPRST